MGQRQQVGGDMCAGRRWGREFERIGGLVSRLSISKVTVEIIARNALCLGPKADPIVGV